MEEQPVFLCILQMKSLTHLERVQQKKNNRCVHDSKLQYVTIYIHAVCVDVSYSMLWYVYVLVNPSTYVVCVCKYTCWA